MNQVRSFFQNRLSREITQIVENIYTIYCRYAHRAPAVYSIDGVEMKLDLSESRMMVKRRLGEFEPEVDEFVTSRLGPSEYFLDIGANRGYHALRVAVARPDSQVVAFEPDPTNAAYLRDNIDRNGLGNVRYIEKAVSESTGTATFRSATGQSGTSHLAKSGETTVEKIAIDEWLSLDDSPDPSDISVCKIDVEGAEKRVLRGMESLLRSDSNVEVMVELHPKAVDIGSTVGFLNDCGVHTEMIRPNYLHISS